MRLLFTADVHGNTGQYRKLFSLARRYEVDAVIVGGDIAPKIPALRSVARQRAYLEDELLPMIAEFFEETHIMTYLIMGNDDFSCNEDLLLRGGIGFEYVHNRIVRLGKWNIAGYGCVPITPFRFKDWEKPDAHDVPESDYRSGFVVEGVTSVSGSLQPRRIDLESRDDCIEFDLQRLKADNLILVTHTPPYDSKLDVIMTGDHVGSIAVKRFIMDRSPVLSLHGHIHETVDMSGSFMERLGSTVMATPGNNPFQERLKVLLIDMEPLVVQRLVV